jgi:signal transduction histidine kinase
MMAVPLRARGRLLGGLLLISSTPTRRYAAVDLDLAKELSLRAALAIDNARLYETARRATQARDDVLGIVAHDLRNPLGAIVMQATLLRRPGAEPERRTRKPFEAIERAAGRANRLIQDLLDVTKLEAGRLSCEPSGLAARKIAADTVEAHEPLASSASVLLRLDMPEHLVDVWADRDRLQQVFENLIGNALKFTPAQGFIFFRAKPHPDELVLFSVTDSGPGIPKENLKDIFNPYWQAKRAERLGAGLGLPIARGIVESHGGKIWVESEPGKGTTFFFTLPAARGAAEAPKLTRAAEAPTPR